MNKITGAILILAATISGHGVLTFVASHPSIRKYDIPESVANMVLVAIGTAVVLGLWGVVHLFRADPQDKHPPAPWPHEPSKQAPPKRS